MLYNTLHLRPRIEKTYYVCIPVIYTTTTTICHGNNLNCFSVNSTVLNDFLLTGGTDDIDSLLHVISSRFLIMF